MTNTAAIETIALIKHYGAREVLRGVDLVVAPGTVFSLLGPNGAGKTTTVRILATLVEPTGGSARVAGFDVRSERRAVRGAISLTGQYAALDELQTGVENLRMMARIAGLDRRAAAARADELLERFDLTEPATRRVHTYSGGMRRRLDLAASLVGRPRVLFLDEPTTGLDPRSRQQMWEVVRELVASGVTVFLTTQYLEEADQLADRIAVIDDGRVVAEGTPVELKARLGEQRIELVAKSALAFEALAAALGDRALVTDGAAGTLAVTTDGDALQVRRLLDDIDPAGTLVARFSLHEATLDDVFLSLTGAAPRGAVAPEPSQEALHV